MSSAVRLSEWEQELCSAWDFAPEDWARWMRVRRAEGRAALGVPIVPLSVLDWEAVMAGRRVEWLTEDRTPIVANTTSLWNNWLVAFAVPAAESNFLAHVVRGGEARQVDVSYGDTRGRIVMSKEMAECVGAPECDVCRRLARPEPAAIEEAAGDMYGSRARRRVVE